MTVDMGDQCAGRDGGDVKQSDLTMSDITVVKRRWWDVGGHGSGRVELSQDCGVVQQFDFIMSGIRKIERRWWGKASLHRDYIGRKLGSFPDMWEMVVIENTD